MIIKAYITDSCYHHIVLGGSASNNDLVLLLKVGSIVLLLALGVVIVALIYYVKKKVHTYQKQAHKYTQTDSNTDMKSCVFPAETTVSASASDDPDGWT